MGLENGYVVASYVGYDNNRLMKSRHIPFGSPRASVDRLGNMT
jgi:hypothetical protein